MKTLDQIAAEMSQNAFYGKNNDIRKKIACAMAFIEKAAIEVKKVSVSKKGPTYSNPSSLHHRGLWGYPQVFVTDGTAKPIRVKHRFALATCFVESDYRSDGNKLFKLTSDHPAVPELFTHEGARQICRGQHGTEDLGAWMAENCPALRELDARVHAEWAKQEAAFVPEADRYIEKLGGRQRINFQNKLAKEFGKHRGDLTGMAPSLLHAIFLFTRDHPGSMDSLVGFCQRNHADAAFIDESDVEAALKLAEISEVMKA